MSPCTRSCLAIVLVLGSVPACAQILGVQELGVEESATTPIVEAGVDAREAASDSRSDSVLPPIDASPDAEGGPAYKRAFVTSARFRGNMGGLAGVDALCTNAAASGGLGGATWMAWTSAGGMNAIDRIVYPGRYVRLDGTTIVSTKAQLASGILLAPIDRTEKNEKATGDAKVWTGTRAEGTLLANCSEWSRADNVLSGILGTTGEWSGASTLWTDDHGQPGLPARACDYEARLYCFER